MYKRQVVLIGDFCLELNEYGQEHDKELLNEIYQKATIIPVDYVMDTSYSYVGVNSEANVGDTSYIDISPVSYTHLDVYKRQG